MSKKISELNEMTSIADNSLFAAVDYSGGNGETKKITYEKLKDALGNEISGIMAYKVVTLTQSSLSASGDSIYPYYYTVSWPSAKATDFTDAAIQTGNYNGSYKVTSNAGNVRLDFTDALTEEITMYVYLQGGEVAEDGSPDDAYYNKPEINSQMGYDGAETSAVASKSHSYGDFFLWQGTPAKAIADIAQGATIASGTNVEMASVFGELSKILGMRDSRGLRYIYASTLDTISLDVVKSILVANCTNIKNYNGVTIVNINFRNNNHYVVAIVNHDAPTAFSAIVFSRASNSIFPYNLFYDGKNWADILLASGRVAVSSTQITTSLANGVWTALCSATIPRGVWAFCYDVSFVAATTGSRFMLFSPTKDNPGSSFFGYNSTPPVAENNETRMAGTIIGTISGDTTIYLNAMQNSGANKGASGKFTAFRLS